MLTHIQASIFFIFSKVYRSTQATYYVSHKLQTMHYTPREVRSLQLHS